jgi:hypothetical protein
MKNKLVYIDFNNGRLCNSGGSVLMDAPSVIMGSKPIIEFHFAEWNNGNTYLPNMSDAVSFTTAIDTDLDITTDPMSVTASGDIVISGLPSGILSVPIDATTSGFTSKVNGKDALQAWMELYGKDSNGDIIYDYRFRINCKGTVMMDGSGPSPAPSTDTMTMVLTHEYIGTQNKTLYKTSTEYNGKSWWCSTQGALDLDTVKMSSDCIYWGSSNKFEFCWQSDGTGSGAALTPAATGDYVEAGTYTADFGMLGTCTLEISY